jgi:hypothetical protein
MRTMNADSHPLMRRMHKPDAKLQSDQQDKRSVFIIEAAMRDVWLTGTSNEVESLISLAPVETFDAAPSV